MNAGRPGGRRSAVQSGRISVVIGSIIAGLAVALAAFLFVLLSAFSST